MQENQDLNSLYENQKKQLNDTLNMDREKQEKMEKLKNILAQLEKNNGKLNKDLEARTKALEEAQNAMQNSQNKINDLLKEI